MDRILLSCVFAVMRTRWWSYGGKTLYCYEKEVLHKRGRRRQRKIPVGRRLGDPRWLNHRIDAESNQMLCACEVEIALKSKYPWFGSRHWVNRDIGTYIISRVLLTGAILDQLCCKYLLFTDLRDNHANKQRAPTHSPITLVSNITTSALLELCIILRLLLRCPPHNH